MYNTKISAAFIGMLRKLKNDAGAMATLRRGLAHEPGEYVPAFPYVAPFVAEESNELPFFLTASLFAAHPEESEKGDFGLAFKTMANLAGASDSIELRFKALLQCRGEELRIHLRSAISMLASKSIPVNYNELFRAIHYWENPEKFIQKQWAKSYWAPAPEKNELTQTTIS